MNIWIWVVVLIAAVWAAHWGAEQLDEPLKKLRRQWGLTQVAGAAFVGLAAASPEIGINTASAVTGVSDIGLGTMLGSNIIAIPIVVTTAYWASRKKQLGDENDPELGEDFDTHTRHREQRLLRVEKTAVSVQAIPYLAIIAVVAALTLPQSVRGLQPIDGLVMAIVYLAYLGQAVFRGRQQGREVQWTKQEMIRAIAGVVVLAIGAYFTVRATENIVGAIGISEIIGGLFITAPMAMLPELFATWSVTRSGQVTAATTSVIGDHAVTMTIAFVPLALATAPVNNLQLYSVNLAFVALMPALYAAFIHWGNREHGFRLWQVIALDCVYLVYLAVMLFGVLNVL